MGQQPNIELSIEDLPRPKPRPGVARRWSPQRPGELDNPSEVLWGGVYGTPGPDAGFVYKLIGGHPLALAEGERRPDAEAAVAVIAGARASKASRGPTRGDVDVARIVLALDPDHGSPKSRGEAAAVRSPLIAGLAHHRSGAGRLLMAVPLDVLTAPVAEIAGRADGGERFLHPE